MTAVTVAAKRWPRGSTEDRPDERPGTGKDEVEMDMLLLLGGCRLTVSNTDTSATEAGCLATRLVH
jgi:hypothetical protein